MSDTNSPTPDVDAGHSRSGLLRSDTRGAAESGGNGRVAGGLVSLPRQPSLLSRLTLAEADIADLIDAWNELPEAYKSGDHGWFACGDLERACELISSARSDLIGDTR